MSPRYGDRPHCKDFICAQWPDGVFRDREDTNRFTQRVEELQDTSARTGGRMVDEIDHGRDVASAKPVLRK